MDVVVNLDFVFLDLGKSPFLPVDELISKVYVPVVSDNLDFESEWSFEISNGYLYKKGKFLPFVLNSQGHLDFKLVDDDKSVFMEGERPCFTTNNSSSNLTLLWNSNSMITLSYLSSTTMDL